MKKLSLLVALALLVSFGAFAQVALDYSVTGSATMEWGVDLNNDPVTHGFKNDTASSLDLSVTLDPASVSKSGEGVYGEIELSGFGVAIGDTTWIKWEDVVKVVDDDGGDESAADPADNTPEEDGYDYTRIYTGFKVTKPDVAAKIVLSDALAVRIASQPDFEYNYAAELIDNETNAKHKEDFNGGMTVMYMSDMVDVNLNYGSKADFEGNAAGDYAVGGDITVKPADIATATIAFAYNPNYYGGEDTPTPLYVGANIDLKPVDMLSVNIGVDAAMPEEGDAKLDADISIPVTLSDSLSLTAAASMMDNGTDDPEMDAKLSVAMSGDASVTLDAMFDDLTDTEAPTGLDMELHLTASYKAALSDSTYVKPGVDATYDMAVVEADADDVVKLKVYADAALIANTVFTIAYETGQLLDDAKYTELNDKGDIKITTKISY